MAKKPDPVRLLGLALVAAAIALYARDCRRTRVEQTALLVVRAAASDPGALVAFRVADPDHPEAAVYRPVRDPAAASNIVAALAATETGWKLDHPVSSRIVEHDVLLLRADRRSAFFRLRRSDGDSRVCVQPAAGPPPVEPAAGPVLSTAGLDELLRRVENGELLDERAGIRLVPAEALAAPTNAPAGAADAPTAP